VIQNNAKNGVIVQQYGLALREVNRSQAGNYTCVASNVEGDGYSNIVELKIMCEYPAIKAHDASTSSSFGTFGRFPSVNFPRPEVSRREVSPKAKRSSFRSSRGFDRLVQQRGSAQLFRPSSRCSAQISQRNTM